MRGVLAESSREESEARSFGPALCHVRSTVGTKARFVGMKLLNWSLCSLVSLDFRDTPARTAHARYALPRHSSCSARTAPHL